MYDVNAMSVDEAMLSCRYPAHWRARDGTVLPPTMTSRRCRQATVSVVDMSLAMDIGCGLGSTPRHQHCYDDDASTRRRAKRVRRRRRHDNGDDVELMDTLDHTPRCVQHVTRDVSTPSTDRSTYRQVPVRDSLYNERATRRQRLVTDSQYNISQHKWTSSRYIQAHLQTHSDRRHRRAAAKSRHKINRRHDVTHSPTDDVTRRAASSPVSHTRLFKTDNTFLRPKSLCLIFINQSLIRFFIYSFIVQPVLKSN